MRTVTTLRQSHATISHTVGLGRDDIEHRSHTLLARALVKGNASGAFVLAAICYAVVAIN
jgi:hypothetical protein